MCSENDIYDPLLIETIQSYNFDFEEKFVIPPHFTLNEEYASYHRKTVTWMVNVEHRNCKLMINIIILCYNYQLNTMVKHFINISTNLTRN